MPRGCVDTPDAIELAETSSSSPLAHRRPRAPDRVTTALRRPPRLRPRRPELRPGPPHRAQAGFQHECFFRRSEGRWKELARTSRLVVVFADFSGPDRLPRTGTPIQVPLPADAPARREWTLVCDSPDYPVCVSGWEFPGQPERGDAGRRFEVIWSVDPQVVRNAANVCAQLARSAHPGLGPLLGALPSEPPARIR